MAERSEGPLIVQSDRTILLETAHPRYEEARDSIARFAELEKSPEHIHTYRLSPLSLWNAAASGLGAAQILAALDELSKYPVPQNVRFDVEDIVGRYGKLRLLRGEAGGLVLEGRRGLPPRRDRAAPGGDAVHRGAPRRTLPRREARRARRAQAVPDQGGIPGRGSRRLRRRSPVDAGAARRQPAQGVPSRCATIKRKRSGSSTPRAPIGAVPASSCCPAAPARRSSASA